MKATPLHSPPVHWEQIIDDSLFSVIYNSGFGAGVLYVNSNLLKVGAGLVCCLHSLLWFSWLTTGNVREVSSKAGMGISNSLAVFLFFLDSVFLDPWLLEPLTHMWTILC